MFDGKKIRDEILSDLAKKAGKMERQPSMAVFLIGHNPVCEKYVELKKKLAEKTGINFCLYKFEGDESEDEIIECIKFMNADSETDGIMIQIPVPDNYNRQKLIEAISPKKDTDGLRYCLGLDSEFRPPVVLAIMEALERAELGISNYELGDKKVIILGKGFLVGAPLARVLEEKKIEPVVIDRTDQNNPNTLSLIHNSDIIISATGKAGIIKPEMVKEGVVLIDAGTAEENGELKGDIDLAAYSKSSYYTPVPGGIGPVTVAMLFRNLIGGN